MTAVLAPGVPGVGHPGPVHAPAWSCSSLPDPDGHDVRHVRTAGVVPVAEVSLSGVGGSDDGLCPVAVVQVEHDDVGEPAEVLVGPVPFTLTEAARLYTALGEVLRAVAGTAVR